jgi:broad specificity phosphatase PhoE
MPSFATMHAMGTLYLVRHGQASLGAADYDQLSPLGARQCQALGACLQAQGLQFEAVLRGSLRRHLQSLAALASAHGALPDAQEWSGLNEYDGDAVLKAFHDGPLPSSHTPEGYKAHFRLLREALLAWMAGTTAPQGMPTYAEWAAGVQAVLDHVRRHCSGNVLVLSSGGPISTAVAAVLGAPPATSVELNLRLRNSAVTELAFNPKRYSLVVFNHLPHLPSPERAAWVTAA